MRRIHQFQHGSELQEIRPQVPLIWVCDYLTPSHMQENNPLQDRALMWKERTAQSHSWVVISEPISTLPPYPPISYPRPRQLNLHWCLWSFTLKVTQPERLSPHMNRNKVLKYFYAFLCKVFLFKRKYDTAWKLEYCISAKLQTSNRHINPQMRLLKRKKNKNKNANCTTRQNSTHWRIW